MSIEASRPVPVATEKSDIPIALPPGRTAANRARRVPWIVAAELPESEAPGFLTPEFVQGWAGSLTLHAILLLSLALWYFAAPDRRPITFDTRLAGSPHGVPEGLTANGGLNTPLAMPEKLLGPEPEPIVEFRPGKFEPTPVSMPRGAARASGGGGRPNDNPGAGEGDGFGPARFGQGGEVIRGVEVKVGDPQFTLIWNTDADLDLHVIEPGGKEIYWEEPKGNKGGRLDVDNTTGFGPENIFWLVDSDGPGSEKVLGPGPPGSYQWFVVYWGGFGGIARPTHWKVRVKHAGRVDVIDGKFQALNERSRTFTLKVAQDASLAPLSPSDAKPAPSAPVLPPEKP